jgi:hypothetical protein
MKNSELKDLINSLESDIRNQKFLNALATIESIRQSHDIPSELDDLTRNQTSLKLLRLEVGV